jgi:hypothetical protein
MNFTHMKLTLHFPPAQKVVDPLGVMVGVAGAAFTVTVVPALAALCGNLSICRWADMASPRCGY